MNPIDRQRDYYARTASSYNASHHGTRGEHDVALDHIVAYAAANGIRSLLDVGAGTGRQAAQLKRRLPGVRVVGLEPVQALIDVGRTQYQLGADELISGDGTSLPFHDDEFDVVIETGVLHHTPQPRRVLGEMTRVAHRAVFLSDSNRFGQGSLLSRIVKLGIFAGGAWPAFYWLKTKGRNYEESAGDGVYFSFSLFDHIDVLQAWADRVWVVPTMPAGALDRRLLRWFGPILGAPHALVCAVREDSSELTDAAGPG
jgi:SAM-dependent methyltransferase